MIRLILEDSSGEKELNLDVKKLVNAGRSGRNEIIVKKHLDELRKAGSNVGDKFPKFWPKTSDRITTSNRFEVLPNTLSSGEVEYVLLIDKNTVYIGVGSDHTDRGIQKIDLVAAKEIYYNVLAPKVWLYEEVKEYWDDLLMSSWVEEEGEITLYQEGKLKEILSPERILEEVKTRIGNNFDGLVIFSGTHPTLNGNLSYSSYFEFELRDNKKNRVIRHSYRADPINWFYKKEADNT